MTEYAIEADPGKCTASFPIFDSLAAARAAADAPALHRDGVPACRILVRAEHEGNWTPVECPKHDDGQHCDHWYDDVGPCCACGDDTGAGLSDAAPGRKAGERV